MQIMVIFFLNLSKTSFLMPFLSPLLFLSFFLFLSLSLYIYIYVVNSISFQTFFV